MSYRQGWRALFGGLLALGATCPAVAAESLPTDEQLALRAGAWDGSVRLEDAGDVEAARIALLRGWGLRSSSYEVTLRIAWLSLKLEDATTAVAAYRRARELRGAGPAATRGLASALSLRGWQAFREGNRAAARADWREARQLHPGQADAQRGLELARPLRIDPELWASVLFQQGAGNDLVGGAVLLHLPVQVTDWLAFRAAYRHVEASDSAGVQSGPGRAGSGAARFRQDDLYAGFGLGTSHLWLEALGLWLAPSDQPAAGGEATRLRLGHRYGVQVEQAALFRSDGARGQLMPTAYVWPLDQLGVGAGARFTFDPVGTDASAVAGATVLVAPLELHLRAHVGIERWPVTMAVPQVLTVEQDLTAGGALSTLWSVSDRWWLGLSGQLERFEQAGRAGVYGTVAAGLRWSPLL